MALTAKIPATARYGAPTDADGYIIGGDAEPGTTAAGTKNISLAIIKPANDVTTSEFATALSNVETMIWTIFPVWDSGKINRLTTVYDVA